jgi:hypothetical protein
MNFIVITSINSPTLAVETYAQLENCRLIVVGDAKSPESWECSNSLFISLSAQRELGFSLESLLPLNHYSRKMLGYLNAIKLGADVIIDTDDDNIPKTDYSVPDFEGNFARTASDLGFINVYNLFSQQPIWPRGLPIDQIKRDDSHISTTDQPCRIGVFQGLADGDPDVDAIYRLTSDDPCHFISREPLVLAKGTVSPFNSQNTFFKRELFPLLYLPSTVTFRFTDILRGLVAQPIMWEMGYELAISSPSVDQIRNPHDYYQDFLSEIPMYVNTRKVLDLVRVATLSGGDVFEMLTNAYLALHQAQIVEAKELACLSSWIADIKKLNSR